MKSVITTVLFSAMLLCSSFSQGQNNTADAAKELLCCGKWSMLVNEQNGKIVALSEEDQNVYIKFNTNGTLVSGVGSQNEEDSEQGEWKLVNNKIIIALSDDTKVYRFTIKNKNNKKYLYATFDIGDGPVTKVMVQNDSK